MSDESVGFYWKQWGNEKYVREKHDAEHPQDTRLSHWQDEDCALCMEEIDADIENEKRCAHGEVGGCGKCQMYAELAVELYLERQAELKENGQ